MLYARLGGESTHWGCMNGKIPLVQNRMQQYLNPRKSRETWQKRRNVTWQEPALSHKHYKRENAGKTTNS